MINCVRPSTRFFFFDHSFEHFGVRKWGCGFSWIRSTFVIFQIRFCLPHDVNVFSKELGMITSFGTYNCSLAVTC